MPFTQADLNISQQELDDLTAALANSTEDDPFLNAMAEQEAKVRAWSVSYTVPEPTLQRLWRPLVLWALATLAGVVSDARQKAYDEAIKELTDIRDGKFSYPQATEDPDNPAADPRGNWGGDTKIAPR